MGLEEIDEDLVYNIKLSGHDLRRLSNHFTSDGATINRFEQGILYWKMFSQVCVTDEVKL